MCLVGSGQSSWSMLPYRIEISVSKWSSRCSSAQKHTLAPRATRGAIEKTSLYRVFSCCRIVVKPLKPTSASTNSSSVSTIAATITYTATVGVGCLHTYIQLLSHGPNYSLTHTCSSSGCLIYKRYEGTNALACRCSSVSWSNGKCASGCVSYSFSMFQHPVFRKCTAQLRTISQSM